MRAIVQSRYGTPDVLELREIERPVPRDNEVSIRVFASSVNPADHIRLTGRPLPARLFFGWRRPTVPVLGMDIAGRVEAVGARVTRFRPGDHVFGETLGAYADYACVAEDRLARKPSNLTFEEAASVPVAGLPALQGLRDKGRIAAGHRVLVNGASGGVGTFAVQIAHAFGADVTAVCSGRNAALVRALGAAHVVDYTRDDFTATPVRYDVILDLVGSAPLARCLRILSPSGTYVSSVGRTGWALRAALRSLVSRRVKVLTATTTSADLDTLRDLLESGAVKPVIDRTFALREVPDALRYQATGRTRGKSVVRVAEAG